MGIVITAFFSFSPLSYVQIDIAIKSWCMFINGLLWMFLGWVVHLIEEEKVKKPQVSFLKGSNSLESNFAGYLISLLGDLMKFFYLSIIFLKVIITVIGGSVLTISILQIRSLGASKIQLGSIIIIFIAALIFSLILILREFSSTSARK
ncbi:MAG: hypothetical protein U9O41_05820 [Candidatus Aerophobetes bacterium]|nr:hypothetical protein [Candidatus Aerophobetes bacterium]